MFCPAGHCLCRTVQSESSRIWNDLQDAETLNSPIHEDTITQTFALTLNRQHGGENRVHIFGKAEETKNGSDFLWLFFSADLSQHFRVAVQAKRLYADGTYSAFKPGQAKAMISYAHSVDAMPIYLFYNFLPFRRGYYGYRGQRRYIPRPGFGFDHPRDLGVVFVPSEEVVGRKSISPKMIAANLVPLWHPFCMCESRGRSPLDELIDGFTSWSEDAEAMDDRGPGSLDTNQQLRAWMEGRRLGPDALADGLAVSRKLVEEPFAPSFMVGTRLGPGRDDDWEQVI